MTANIESNITLQGKTDELMKMLKYLINNEYYDDDFDLRELSELSDEDLKKYIIEEGNKINLFIIGPYGRFYELPDTRVFEGLADAAPNASFKGEMSRIYGPTEYSVLSANFKDKQLNLKHMITYGMADSYLEYLKSIIPVERFCELFHIVEDDFDIYDYTYFFEQEYLEDVSFNQFQEYFNYAKIKADEFKKAIGELIKLEIEDCHSYIKSKSEENAETWIYKPLDKKTKEKPLSTGEKIAREISQKPEMIEIEGKKYVTTWCDRLDSYITSKGGIIKSKVVLDTDYIIIGNNIQEEGSLKTRKALELNKTKGKNIIAMTDIEFENILKNMDKGEKI